MRASFKRGWNFLMCCLFGHKFNVETKPMVFGATKYFYEYCQRCKEPRLREEPV